MPDILTRLENVVDSATFVRKELKKRLKKYKDAGIELDMSSGLGRALTNSVFGLDLICKKTHALRMLFLHLSRLSTIFTVKDVLPVATSAQRDLVVRYAKHLYRYPEQRYRGIILVPMKNYEEVLRRCINGLFKDNALIARNIRREMNWLQ